MQFSTHTNPRRTQKWEQVMNVKILFTTMMLALITTSAEAQDLRKAPREGEQPLKAPVSRPRPLISQSSAI